MGEVLRVYVCICVFIRTCVFFVFLVICMYVIWGGVCWGEMRLVSL